MLTYLRSGPLLAIIAVAVVALFVLGAQPLAVGIVPTPYDKLAHAVVFGLLFVALDHALLLPLWLAIVFPLLVSLADEAHQMWLPGRQAGFEDWFAGLVGVILAALLFRRHRD